MKRLLIACTTLMLAGCATGPSADQQEDAQCQGWGASPETAAYANCRAQLYQARMQRIAAVLGYMQANQPAPIAFTPIQGAPATRPAERPKIGLTCLYRSEGAAGLTKVCNYDCGGSPGAMTVSGADICPLTMTH